MIEKRKINKIVKIKVIVSHILINQFSKTTKIYIYEIYKISMFQTPPIFLLK